MTQPEPEELPEVPAEEVTALEVAAVAAVTGGLAAALAPALGAVLALWQATQGSVVGGVLVASGLPDIKRAIARHLSQLTWPRMSAPLADYAEQAQVLGRGRAWAQVPGVPRVPVPLAPVPGVDLDRLVRERLDDAARLARVLPLDTKGDVRAVIGRAASAKSLAEGVTRGHVYEGLSLGKEGVARATGRNLLWVPERDACLHCLAHAGWVWRPGARLPKGLTYADKPLKVRVRHPPLHPNCRCEAVLTMLPVGAPSRERSRLDPAARLAAEARRSVVSGWTDHASQAATLRAMDRLLKQGADLPVSVESRARAAVRAGRTVRRPR